MYQVPKVSGHLLQVTLSISKISGPEISGIKVYQVSKVSGIRSPLADLSKVKTKSQDWSLPDGVEYSKNVTLSD